MKVQISLIFLLVLCMPNIGRASVLINEVAWMGTTVGPNEEWIELYNDGTESVNVDGWTLGDDVSLTITLTGAVGAGEYAVLERTDDTTVAGTAFQIYTGALANDGRTLTLHRSDASIEDQVSGGSNWEAIGGNNDTKETAQRTTTGWLTGTPTPGVSNTSANTEQQTEAENTGTESNITTTTHSSSGGGSSTSKKNQKTIAPILATPELELSVDLPRIAYVNQEIDFEVTPSGLGKTLMNSLVYTWNFGDTYTASSKKVSHSFAYPGEYIVVVHATFAKQSALLRHEITVLPVSFELSRTEIGDVRIKNTSPREIDIGNYTLKGGTTFSFPEFTFIKPNSSLMVNKNRISPAFANVELSDALGTEVATMHIAAAPPTSFVSRTLPAVVAPHEVVTEKTNNPSALDTQTETPNTSVASESSSTIIQIGNTHTAEAEEGILHKVFKRIWNIFSS